jgi:flavin reductase (DIM6/NTAB) family NADH-FMN oxidoreductase RutF
MPETELTPIARALGRIPCGLYIVTTQQGEEPIGFLGSFVMQVGFEPPTLCVAIGKDRDHLAAVRESGRFALSVIDPESTGQMSPFFKKPAEGESPFDALATRKAPGGSVVLAESLAWLECRVTGEHATGDHVVVFGEVLDAEILRAGDPKVHLRKNGLSY